MSFALRRARYHGLTMALAADEDADDDVKDHDGNRDDDTEARRAWQGTVVGKTLERALSHWC